MVGGWKLSLADSCCGEVPSWQSTPRWSLPPGRMRLPDAMQRTRTTSFWRKLETKRKHPEMVGNGGRARYVVVAADVCGVGWGGGEGRRFLLRQPSFCAASFPRKFGACLSFKGKAGAAWSRRWRSMMGCVVANFHALSLVGRVPRSAWMARFIRFHFERKRY